MAVSGTAAGVVGNFGNGTTYAFSSDGSFVGDPDDDGDACRHVRALGLKLEARRAPIDAIVVNEARRTPLEN